MTYKGSGLGRARPPPKKKWGLGIRILVHSRAPLSATLLLHCNTSRSKPILEFATRVMGLGDMALLFPFWIPLVTMHLASTMIGPRVR